MATRTAAKIIAQLPEFPRMYGLGQRKAIAVRSRMAVACVLEVALSNPEHFYVSPCRQFVARLGGAARFQPAQGDAIGAVDSIITPAFDTDNAGGLFLVPDTGVTVDLQSDSMSVSKTRQHRFSHVFATVGKLPGHTAVRVIRDPAADAGVNTVALSSNDYGKKLEAAVFAHLGPPRDDGRAFNLAGLRTVQAATGVALATVIEPLLREALLKSGHCTMDRLFTQSRWCSLSHILPSLSQAIADAPRLCVVGNCVFLRDPDAAREILKARAVALGKPALRFEVAYGLTSAAAKQASVKVARDCILACAQRWPLEAPPEWLEPAGPTTTA